MACKKRWPSWNRDILSQLDIPHRKQFPALLAYRYACDESVVLLLRDRTTGNSPSQLARKLQEEHRHMDAEDSILSCSLSEICLLPNCLRFSDRTTQDAASAQVALAADCIL